MQVQTKHYSRNCLLTVMDQYSAVVRNMEQVVMIPSLLRDMHFSVQGHQAQEGAPDLYNYFTMLKAICMDMDHGLLHQEEWRSKVAGDRASEAKNEAAKTEDEDERNLEAQFRLHFSSLHHILTHLNLKAEEVTRTYQEIIGQAK